MMRPILRSTIVLLLFASALPALSLTVSGTVRSASSNSPLTGMIVEAYDETGSLKATGTTNATGLYVLNVPAGRYRILAYDNAGQYATSFGGNSESFETSQVFTISASTTVDFKLHLAAFIAGYVTSSAGTPLPHITVAAYNMSGTRRGFTSTNAAGFFFLAVPPGPYRLAAYDDRGVWSTVFYGGALSFDQARTVTVSAPAERADIGIVTTRAARISGKVVDAAAAVPLASIVVYAYTPEGDLVATAATDGLGNFSLYVPPGTYRVVAGDPSRTFATEYFGGSDSFATSPRVTVSSSDERTGVNFAMRRGGTVQGRVVGADGSPLKGILVTAYNPDGTLQSSTLTDADGRYALTVREGEAVVVASDPLLIHATQFNLRAATFKYATRLGVAVGQVYEGVDFSLSEGGRLHGTVRAVAGFPVAGVTVAAYDAAGALVASDVTGADGVYNIVVPGGAYRLVVFDTSLRYAASFAGGATSYESSTPVSATVRGVTETDFVVTAGVRVSGTTVSRDGTTLSGIEISALDPAGNSVGGAISSGGSFTLVLLPGTYRFVARDARGQYRTLYYSNAATLAAANVVSVSGGQVPAPLAFVLDAASRRRAIGR